MCDVLPSQSEDSAELLHVESDNGVDILSDLWEVEEEEEEFIHLVSRLLFLLFDCVLL